MAFSPAAASPTATFGRDTSDTLNEACAGKPHSHPKHAGSKNIQATHADTYSR